MQQSFVLDSKTVFGCSGSFRTWCSACCCGGGGQISLVSALIARYLAHTWPLYILIFPSFRGFPFLSLFSLHLYSSKQNKMADAKKIAAAFKEGGKKGQDLAWVIEIIDQKLSTWGWRANLASSPTIIHVDSSPASYSQSSNRISLFLNCVVVSLPWEVWCSSTW